MKWCHPFLTALVAVAGLGAGPVLSQPVSVSWPLTSSTAASSSLPGGASGAPAVLSPGTAPTVSVFDYWSGQGQRLNAGSTGWTAGPASPTRYLQFDASPMPGHQLTVSSVSFEVGGANVPNQIRAEVRYSIDNWVNSNVLLAPAVVYAPQAMNPFTIPVTVPPVPSGGTFSLRIHPYAIIPSSAMAPTFAVHRNVAINGTASASGGGGGSSGGGGGGGGAQVRLQVTKNTGAQMVPGTYQFGISCTGGTGAYTGPSAIQLTVPGAPQIVGVPQGATCTLTETPVPGWTPPIWASSPTPNQSSGWTAQVGPMNVNTQLTVSNNPGGASGGGGGASGGGGGSGGGGAQVRLQITKNTGAQMVPGTYQFGISCTGGTGAYTGPSAIQLTVPGAPQIVGVPQGATCTLTETPVPGWTPPIWASSPTPNQSNGWTAQVGPMNVNTQLTVSNRPGGGGGGGAQVRLQISKNTGAAMRPGTYTFSISCTGGSGPYTGPATVTVTVPGAPVTTGVPQGATCTVTETPVAGWQTPAFSASGSPLTSYDWTAQVGPMNVNTALTVSNRPR